MTDEERVEESTEENPAESGVSASRDFEAEAREQGWRPQEDFNGDPERWVDAETFVKRGEEFLPFVKADRDKLREELRAAEAKFENRIQRMEKVHSELSKKQRLEYEKQVAELREARKKAVQEADGEAFELADTQLRNLEVQTNQDAQVELPPEEVEWRQKNASWWGKDVAMTAAANAIGQQVWSLQPNLPPDEFFAKVDERLKEEFPHKYGENPRKRTAQRVEGASAPAPRKGGKSFESLPDEAKKAYSEYAEHFKNAGQEFKKEDYAKLYWESESA